MVNGSQEQSIKPTGDNSKSELEQQKHTRLDESMRRVIVVFEDSRVVSKILRRFKKTFFRKLGYTLLKYFGLTLFVKNHIHKGYALRLMKAPEPSDIIWENLDFRSEKKKWRMFLTTIIIFVLMSLSFGVLVVLKTKLRAVQNMQTNDPNNDTDQYVSIIISLTAATLVAAANTTLGIFIRKFARFEKHKTQTKYFVSTGRRLTAALFINMTFTTILANVLHSRRALSIFAFWKISVTGLFYDIFFLFITNSYMSSIFNFFDLVWGYKLCRRRKALKLGKDSPMTQ